MDTAIRTIALALIMLSTSNNTPAVEMEPAPVTVALVEDPVGSRSHLPNTDTGPDKPSEASPALTTGQQELVDWAKGRFAAAGLELPAIRFQFSPTTLDCMGHKGLYYVSELRLHMCSLDKRTMLHELAHAWAHVGLSTGDQASFVEFRGVAAWNDEGDAWEQRGTEHAAEIIAWGLMDEPTHIRWVEDGAESFRLLTIPDADVEALAQGFELLTGFESPFRQASEWEPAAAGFSPEQWPRQK